MKMGITYYELLARELVVFTHVKIRAKVDE